MDKIIDQIVTWHTEGRKVALGIVLKTWGSAPRQPGSMMAIASDQQFIGSLSGGCIEGSVIAEAQQLGHFGGAKKLEYGVENEDAWEVGLACGGQIEILILLVTGESVEALKTLKRKTKNGQPASLQIMMKDGTMSVTTEKASDISSTDVIIQSDRVLVPMLPNPKLVIIGAVHIAQILAPLAIQTGYDVVIVDPREAFTDQPPFQDMTISNDWPDDYIKKHFPDQSTAIVALTHDAKLDDAALKFALRSPAFYIGALGSKKTQTSRDQRLVKEGFTPAQLTAIKGPVGLDIGAKTPAEIAVAIMAEIIATKRLG